MNRREDPLLRQHCSRLLQLAETTNIKPGHGSGKRRGQRTSHGFGPSTSARITLQDIVRNDPGYTTNIEHLVFPDRKGSNPNLTSQTSGGTSISSSTKIKSSNSSGTILNASINRSRLVEVFTRPYIRGSTSLDGGGGSSGVGVTGGGTISTSSSSGHPPSSGSVSSRSNQRRWLSQTSQQSSRQQSNDDGGSHVGPVGVSSSTTTSASGQQPRRVSPALDPTEITNSAVSSSTVGSSRSTERSERASNVSIHHLRGTSSTESWGESGGQMSSFPGSRSNSYTRPSSISNLKRHDITSTSNTSGTSTTIVNSSSMQSSRNNHHHRRQDNQNRRRDATNSFLTGSGGTSGELFVSGNCSRELSPVRWCDREVDGVYLGRSGWVQVQQRSLDENRKTNYESNSQVNQANSCGGVSGVSGTIPLPRRATVKLADYHCSNSEPGKYPDYVRSLTLDSHRPDFLKLHSADYEPPSECVSPPHSIPESFSPPSITPIISPPPAFQDVTRRMSSRSSRSMISHGKAFLPRSNAIIDSDVISPPLSPSLNINWANSSSMSRKSGLPVKPRPRRPIVPQVSGNTAILQQRQDISTKQYRLASAKSLEDQSSTRRSQFAQRYRESSSSSSSSMGFRSLDSCVNITTMPRLAENTDSSVEGYEDGDEDDNPDSSLNISVVSSPGTALDSSPEGKINQDRGVSPSGRQSRLSRSQQTLRRSPGSSDAGKLSFETSSSSSSTASSVDRNATGRSPTPNQFKRSNPSRHNQTGFRNALSPDSLQTARVRRSRSLQLPEKKSPNSTSHSSQQVSREHSRESNESNRVVVKIINDRSAERTKRHPLSNRKAQSTDDTLSIELHREPEAVTEYLYGTRSRPITRSHQLSSRYDTRDDTASDRRNTTGPYDVYFISAKQPRHQQSSIINYSQQQQQQQSSSNNRQRPRTLQRGATTPNSNISSASNDSKMRCNTSTCDFWPHCSQKETLYSPNQSQAFMKLSQSYPSHPRISIDSIISHSTRDRGSACSSPAALDVIDDRDTMNKARARTGERYQNSKQDQERLPKSVLKQSRRSPVDLSQNGIDLATRWEYRNAHSDNQRRISPVQSKITGRSSNNGGATSSITTSSSSSSDIWVTTSDRTVTKSPKNPKSSGGSTPMEDAIAGSLKTLQQEPIQQSEQSRPGSAPAKREDSPNSDRFIEPHQRSSSLPKSFLTHDSTADG
ncbi:hypothetical protein PV328_002993 [Microctonus aethiopoides]|uniref:Uncharacterized protein n=1 Tax=Microctonus aethiopoides TaxID=144406 RepID=A0AA39F7F8_9HYME|nr:hypothetical protein PV328_002993 [Microctonus aethiopoides]